MAVTLPKIVVEFIQRATSLIARSQRGVAILVIRDATNTESKIKSYTSQPGVIEDKALYTPENYAAILDMLSFAPYLSYVVRIGSGDTLSAALELIERNIPTGWVGIAGATGEDTAALASWIKDKEQRYTYYRAVVYNASAPDSMHVVNFANEKVVFADGRGEQPGEAYIPSLVGLLASCNIKRAATNYLCANLVRVEEVANPDKAVGKGKFILENAGVDEVRVVLGINSMTTTNGTTQTEDMQYIETVEAMDMISDDIRSTFKNEYQGKYKNNLDNQMLFISAINGYFKELSRVGTDVLDREYDNHAEVDVEVQRDTWIASGKEEAAEWDDDTVRRYSYKRDVFLAGDIKILNAMTSLRFRVNMM